MVTAQVMVNPVREPDQASRIAGARMLKLGQVHVWEQVMVNPVREPDQALRIAGVRMLNKHHFEWFGKEE